MRNTPARVVIKETAIFSAELFNIRAE